MEIMLTHNIMSTEMSRKVNITSGFLLLLIAVTVLAGPRRTLIVAAAAAVHELGHLLALRALGARVERFALAGAGARIMFTKRLSYPAEMAAALSGPLAGALLAGFSLWAGRRWGGDFLLELAAVSALYTAVNLVPASITDGGRALEAAVSLLFGPDAAWGAGLTLDILCVTAAFIGGCALLFRPNGSAAVLFYAFFLLNGCCKKRRFGVKSKMGNG